MEEMIREDEGNEKSCRANEILMKGRGINWIAETNVSVYFLSLAPSQRCSLMND